MNLRRVAHRSSVHSVALLLTTVLFFRYQTSVRPVRGNLIVVSATFYAESKIYPRHSVVLLFNAEKSLRRTKNFACQSGNTTHSVTALAKPEFAYNPTRECKLATFILVCPVAFRFATFSIADPMAANNAQDAKVTVRSAFVKRSPVIACFSPLFYFERWQLLLTSLEIYSHFGADLQILYIQSILAETRDILRHYEHIGKVAVEPWPTHDFSASQVASLGFDPNLELDWRNQATAHTDCLLKYREAADFIVIADIDDVLVPRLAPDYWSEFTKLSHSLPKAAAFAYKRFNVRIQESASARTFSLKDVLLSAHISQESENAKYVLDTRKVQTAWIHWPGIFENGTQMMRMPEEHLMLHLRNWSLNPVLRDPKQANTVQVGRLFSAADISAIETQFKRTVKEKREFALLSTKQHYAQAIVDCYDDMFYSKSRQPQFCPGPAHCRLKPLKGVRCWMARKPLAMQQISPHLTIHSEFSASSFLLLKNGCSMR